MAGPVSPELLELRGRIDALDRDLLGLLNRRAALAQQVGELKKREGGTAFRPEREAQVIDGLKAINPGPLGTDSVAPIWREIMSACRALETPTRVAYLGPAGTFSEGAALGYFGSSIVRVPCASIDDVFRCTTAGAADFGVVPVENSTEGVVARSLDLLLHSPLSVVGETSLAVRHNLLRRSDSLDGVTAVLAHPQALASATAGSPRTCRRPSAALRPATPRARALPRSTPRWRRSPANAPAASTGCTSSRPRSRTSPTTAPASRSSRTPIATRRRGPAATTARASWSASRTGRARCTTCSCR